MRPSISLLAAVTVSLSFALASTISLCFSSADCRLAFSKASLTRCLITASLSNCRRKVGGKRREGEEENNNYSNCISDILCTSRFSSSVCVAFTLSFSTAIACVALSTMPCILPSIYVCGSRKEGVWEEEEEEKRGGEVRGRMGERAIINEKEPSMLGLQQPPTNHLSTNHLSTNHLSTNIGELGLAVVNHTHTLGEIIKCTL